MANKTQAVTLYHGTARAYSGVPTQGGKDLLGSGYPSMSGNPEVAESFAGGSRTSRVYSLDVPKSQILDLTKESGRLSEQGKWEEMSKLIQKAAASGKYQAVAHYDITYGTDDPEYRFVGKVPKESWQVRPSADAQEHYAPIDAILKRFNAGEKITDKERRQTLRSLKEDAQGADIKIWEKTWAFLDKEGRGDEVSAEDREAQRENYKKLTQQIQALKSKSPPGKAKAGEKADGDKQMPTHDKAAEVRKTLSDTITAFEANKVFAGKAAGADAKKNRKLQNNVIAAYKASLKAVDDGDYTKAKEHADAAVKAVESAGGIIPATQVGAHGEGATVIYTSGGAKANHIGTLHIAAKVGGLSEDKAPPANKEKGPEGGSKKGETQGEKAKDSGESNYPTPSLHKGQELVHIDYKLGGEKRKIPLAAYPVESTPHLVVHRGLDVTKDGDDYDIKVESDGWVITQKDTGLKIASSYKGTLKGGRELAEEIGKHGDWKDEKTAQDTVPKEVTMALGGLAKGQDAGNLDKAIDSVKKVEVKEAAGKTVPASGEPPTWAKLRTDGYGEILDDVGPPPEFGRQGENTKPPLKRDVEDLEESFKRDRLMSDVLGIKPEDISNLSRTGAKEANVFIGSVNLAIFNDQYRRADKLKAEKDAQEEKDKKKTEADKEPEGESKKAVSNDEKPYGPGWVSPKGETWESLDTETQEWLKKRRAEIAESKDKFDKREAWLKEFEKQKPDLEKRDEIGYVFSNGYVRLKDGDVVAFDEFLKTHQEDKEPKDKPANPVGQAEEVSEKEAPKAKTDKEGYITLSGKMFGRAKKSNPKGDPTPGPSKFTGGHSASM